MFNSLPPLVRVPLRWGGIASVIGFALILTLYYMNRHPFLVPVFFDFRIILFAVCGVFILRELRDFYFDGILFFWQGMIANFIFTFLFALMVAIMMWLFTKWEPEFVTTYIQQTLEQIQTYSQEDIDRIGKEVFEQGVKSVKEADGFFMARRYFSQSFILSFFISIIISVILRRQPKTP